MANIEATVRELSTRLESQHATSIATEGQMGDASQQVVTSLDTSVSLMDELTLPSTDTPSSLSVSFPDPTQPFAVSCIYTLSPAVVSNLFLTSFVVLAGDCRLAGLSEPMCEPADESLRFADATAGEPAHLCSGVQRCWWVVCRAALNLSSKRLLER